MSHNYTELDQYYLEYWADHRDLSLHVPMTSGWNRYLCYGPINMTIHGVRLRNFKFILQAMKNFMDDSQNSSPKIGVICCWSEYGEGPYIEPTKAQGISYLEKIMAVFGGGTL